MRPLDVPFKATSIPLNSDVSLYGSFVPTLGNSCVPDNTLEISYPKKKMPMLGAAYSLNSGSSSVMNGFPCFLNLSNR